MFLHLEIGIVNSDKIKSSFKNFQKYLIKFETASKKNHLRAGQKSDSPSFFLML